MAFVPNGSGRMYRNLYNTGKDQLRKISGNNKLANHLFDASFDVLYSHGINAAHHTVNGAMNKLRQNSRNIPINKNTRVGVVSNGDRSILHGLKAEIPYKHTSTSFSQSPTCGTRIYKTTFNVGPHSPKSLYKYGDNRTINSKVLVDTERDYLDTNSRTSLNFTYGFNQRSYDFFLGSTVTTVGDIRFLFKDYKTKVNKLATKNYYGALFYEHTHFFIKSETDYYTVRLKLHLVKITNPELDITGLFKDTFEMNDLSVANPHKIPIDRQLSLPSSYGNVRIQVLTDLKGNLKSSDGFKNNAKVVKTFYRNLGPGDAWSFDYYLHYGPGVLLNSVFDENVCDGHPLGYFFVLQSDGDPRASVTRTSDGQNFNGTSPGRFNVSFKKTLKFVKEDPEGKEVFSVREFIKNDEDFEDTEFQDYFSPNRSTKINSDYLDVNTDSLENKSFPYQLRFGQGRLAVYVDPALRSWLNKNQPDPETPDATPTNHTNSTDYEESTLDPNAFVPSDQTVGLRGPSDSSDNTNSNMEDNFLGDE